MREYTTGQVKFNGITIFTLVSNGTHIHTQDIHFQWKMRQIVKKAKKVECNGNSSTPPLCHLCEIQSDFGIKTIIKMNNKLLVGNRTCKSNLRNGPCVGKLEE